MRSVITLLLVSTLAIGGCDRQSRSPEQANAAENAASAAPGNETAPEALGTVDRSQKGKPAPDYAFQAPDGKQVTLAAFRGRPVLLNLWATWCAPCIKEMPTLDALAGTLGGSVKVLTVSEDLEGATKVKPFFAKGGFQHLEAYLDPDINFSSRANLNLPTTILYDSQGKEVWRVAGGMDWASDEARKLVAEAS